MKKRIQTEDAFFLGDEERPDESIENAQTGVTRQSFEQRFRRFFTEGFDKSDPCHKLLGKIIRKQMDGFFTIADTFTRELAGTPGTKKKRKLLADYRNSEKLMAGTEERINEVREFARQFVTTGRSRTGPVARHILTQLDSLQKRLDSDFDAIRHSIDIQKRRIPQFLVKTLAHDLLLDLEKYIGNEFPKLDRKNRDILIAAALAGAGVFTPQELKNGEDILSRIPMKVWRAKKHWKSVIDNQTDIEGNTPAGRVFTVLRARKKKQKAVAVVGKRGGGRGKQ
jgi:hypothetical protein